ncbi:MAG: PEPxxWA-CTERM sorting domain-containing protein [Pontixanthobacter sp.]
MKYAAILLAATTVCTAAPANAAEVLFDFSGSSLFGGSDITGSGVFTVSDTASTVNGREAFAITAISGMLNGSPITGLRPGFFGADNFFYDGEFFVRGQGIGFRNAAGTSANLFLQQGSRYRVNTTGPFNSAFVTANANRVAVNGAVPEPATWAMMLVGFFGMGAVLRRRSQGTVRVAYS